MGGFTPQYEALEALHAHYRDAGLVVLGFPSNDFAQETGSDKEIADFCESTFLGSSSRCFRSRPCAAAMPIRCSRNWQQQTGRAPLWNFHKYLISRDGKVVDNYSSLTRPDDPALVKALERELARH